MITETEVDKPVVAEAPLKADGVEPTEIVKPIPQATVPANSVPISYPTETQKGIIWSGLTLVALLAIFAGAALIFVGFVEFLTWSNPILLPMALAMLLAILLDPPVTFLCRKGLKRIYSTVLVFAFVLIGISLFLTVFLPSLVAESSGFFKALDPVKIRQAIDETGSHLAGLSLGTTTTNPGPILNTTPTQSPTRAGNGASSTAPKTPGEIDSQEQRFLQDNLSALPQEIANFLYSALIPVGQAFGFILGFAFVPIYAFYFVVDREAIVTGWKDFVPLRKEWFRDEVLAILEEISYSLVNYFRGQIVVASCNGFFTTVGLFTIGVPNSLFLGVITGALSVVPYLGIIVSIIPCILLALASPANYSSDSGLVLATSFWVKPVLVLVVFGCVQMIESLFVSPRVQSHSTGLHPMFIILGLLFWSSILPGLLGPVMAVPLTCSLVVLMRRFIWEKELVARPK